MTEEKRKELEEAIKIVGPVAAMCGVSEKDTKIIIEFVDALSDRGISGRQAGTMLRNYLKNMRLQSW